MTQFTIHTIETAPEDGKELMAQAKKSYGIVPNLIGGMIEAPATTEAYMALSRAVMKMSFTPTERHVVWFTANSYHNCTYCMAGHTGIAHREKVPQDVIDASRSGRPFADDRLNVLRDFTLKMIEQRGWVEPADIDTFIAAGFTRRNVIEIVGVIAHKVISNYTNHIVQTPVDARSEQYAWSKDEMVAAE
ncbi:carboxymuconolactone decarboxylase family protein [Minwuia sp.]|uniref:carboxymuconolactone decarboxylase family protein n=1 Tax=Minwuia sp. TaxID=2493630 RepID=UPI003A914CE2